MTDETLLKITRTLKRLDFKKEFVLELGSFGGLINVEITDARTLEMNNNFFGDNFDSKKLMKLLEDHNLMLKIEVIKIGE